jgi:hypothetical protein
MKEANGKFCSGPIWQVDFSNNLRIAAQSSRIFSSHYMEIDDRGDRRFYTVHQAKAVPKRYLLYRQLRTNIAFCLNLGRNNTKLGDRLTT